MSSFAVSVRTVFFECPLRWFLRPAGASLSRWSSSSALRTRSASAFFSSSKSPSLLKTSFGSRPSRSWSRVSFLIAISALRRRHYGPAHKIPDSPDGSCIRLRPEHRNHVWSYDFVEDRTHDRRRFRMLNVIDEFTHECLAIRVARKLKAIDVIDVLSDLFILRGVPGHIRSDNGPEFI